MYVVFLCEFNKSSYSISVASLLLCRRQPCATVLKKTPIPYAISHMMLLLPKAIYPFCRGEEKRGEGNVLTVKKGLQLMPEKACIEYISSLYHSLYPYHAHIRICESSKVDSTYVALPSNDLVWLTRIVQEPFTLTASWLLQK